MMRDYACVEGGEASRNNLLRVPTYIPRHSLDDDVSREVSNSYAYWPVPWYVMINTGRERVETSFVQSYLKSQVMR